MCTTVKELAEPESEIANLIEHAIHEWQSSEQQGTGMALLLKIIRAQRVS